MESLIDLTTGANTGKETLPCYSAVIGLPCAMKMVLRCYNT